MLPTTNDNRATEDELKPLQKDVVNKTTSQPIADKEGEELVIGIVRQKLESIFDEGPSAKEEISEIKTTRQELSKHQKYMDSLSQSGKSLAEIQTAWHAYYVGLPDKEKFEVWEEFYEKQGHPDSSFNVTHNQQNADNNQSLLIQSHNQNNIDKAIGVKHKSKHRLTSGTSHHANTKRSQHRKSLLFGLSMGVLSLFIMMFGFFNERFIAPFITPSKIVNSTPMIIDSSTAVGSDPRIIIPKINVDIPVVYDETSTNDKLVQHALERGALHYATTSKPGEKGNVVIFGHSSNNILNRGKYKFAFVLLSKLEQNDTFILNKDGVRYVYKIYEKKIVKPDDLSVLSATDRTSVATLITCDPPGTSRNRLIVVGEQISPNPEKNTASSADTNAKDQPSILPSNAPSLWQRIKDWIFS